MFKQTVAFSIFVLALASQVSGHCLMDPPLGIPVGGTRNDVTRPSKDQPCGAGVNVQAELANSQKVPVNPDGTFTVTATNFNKGVDGSRMITETKTDTTATGNNFAVDNTMVQNGDRSSKTLSTQQLIVQMPPGTQCAGGDDGKTCVVSFKTAGGFGNCVAVTQAGSAANSTTATNTAAAAGNSTTTDSTTTTGDSTDANGADASSASSTPDLSSLLSGLQGGSATSAAASASATDASTSGSTSTDGTSTDAGSGDLNSVLASLGVSTASATGGAAAAAATPSASTADASNAAASSSTDSTSTDSSSTDGNSSGGGLNAILSKLGINQKRAVGSRAPRPFRALVEARKVAEGSLL